MESLDTRGAPARAYLIDDWRSVLRRAWSARVALGSVLFWSGVGGLIMVWPALAGSIPPLAYAAIGVALSVAFGVARFLKQPGADA